MSPDEYKLRSKRLTKRDIELLYREDIRLFNDDDDEVVLFYILASILIFPLIILLTCILFMDI